MNLVLDYLEISQRVEFMKRFRVAYVENQDYERHATSKKNTKDVKSIYYCVNLDTFEKICMASKSKKANEVRDYFILLRKFIHYYKDHISDMILDNAARLNGKCVYILVADAKKDIFKFGKTDDLRKRLRTYITGRCTHPAIKFIMLVENKDCVETCVKALLYKFQYRKNQEIYKIELDTIRKAIMTCGVSQLVFNSIPKDNIKSYLIFDDAKD